MHSSLTLMAVIGGMMRTLHLEELARQVRGHTLRVLEACPEECLRWAPAGTSNHVLWHAGHALWVVDLLCIEPLAGASELPDGWAETFGADCRPVNETTEWPEAAEVRVRLERQLVRLLALMRDNEDRLSRMGPDSPGRWDLTRGVIHGLHDEARHHGEMYLLLKLYRTAE